MSNRAVLRTMKSYNIDPANLGLDDVVLFRTATDELFEGTICAQEPLTVRLTRPVGPQVGTTLVITPEQIERWYPVAVAFHLGQQVRFLGRSTRNAHGILMDKRSLRDKTLPHRPHTEGGPLPLSDRSGHRGVGGGQSRATKAPPSRCCFLSRRGPLRWWGWP